LPDFFSYELDIRELKRKHDYKSLLRRRLNWPAGRGTRNANIRTKVYGISAPIRPRTETNLCKTISLSAAAKTA
jgi:hypothetical protein